MPEYRGEREPTEAETEQLLMSLREGVIRSAYDRLDDARVQEELSGRVYVQDAPMDTQFDDVQAIMLTMDGVRPYKDEALEKEQLILFFPPDSLELIVIQAIRDGHSEMFTLDKFGLSPQVSIEDIISSADETAVEPTAEDVANVVLPLRPMSETARLSALRERIERMALTPQD